MTPATANRAEVPTLADRLASAIAEMRTRGVEYRRCVREIKRIYLVAVLKANRGNVSHAAREIGMHRNSMMRMLDEFEINAAEIRIASRVGKKQPRPAFAPEQTRESLIG
jgi:Fis family transcriptional regulator